MPKLFRMDNFDNCVLNDGLFCVTQINLTPMSYKNLSEAWNTIERLKTDAFYFRHDWLRHGICLHDSCPRISRENYTIGFNNTDLMNDISLCYSQKYEHMGLKATTVSLFCEGREPYYNVDFYDKLFAWYIFTIVALLIIGSFHEGLARYKSQEEYNRIVESPIGKFFACFSIVKNWKKLRQDNESVEATQLVQIQGIRTFNTMIVILCHLCTMSFMSFSQNPKFLEEITKRPENAIFSNGNHAVMTFFMISAFLFSYRIFLTFEGDKQFSLKHIVQAILHRCIRLYPCYLTAIAFHATWLIHFERGPHFYNAVLKERNNCRENWWTSALFINTFVRKENQCMQHAWYLATESQIFFFALFIMAVVVKYKKYALHILLSILVVTLIVPICICYYYDVPDYIIPCGECFHNTFANSSDWHLYQSQPLCSIASYVLGLIYGYLFYKYLSKNQYDFVNKLWVQIVWWILVLVGSLGSFYIGIIFMQEDYVHNRWLAAVNAVVPKTFFAACMGLIIFGIQQNIGWFIKYVLRWKPAHYLGRLTYCCYLLHSAVMRLRFVIERNPIYSSLYFWVSESIGAIGSTFLYAILLCLLVEMPFANMQKLYLTPASKASTDKSVTKAKKEK